MLDVRPVLIMAGGTGGHVFPALAVADELRVRGIPVMWLGTRAGIEARLVPEAGYPIEWLNVTGLRGKGLLSLLKAPLTLVRACWQASSLIRKVRPCAVLGMGGFASGPGGIMAWMSGKPLLVHEQNAIPGLTNKLLARFATVIMQAFPSAFGSRARTLGNPVRQEICDIDEPAQRLSAHHGRMKVLVIGGSLGATRLNEIVPATIARLDEACRPEIIHQTGERNIDEATAMYQREGVEADIRAFIEDMAEAYRWADLVICRSGAMTVFELAAAGMASILVPYPHAVDDHQTANARYLESAGAAIIRQQSELDEEWLSETLTRFIDDREKILLMSRAARSLAITDAARQIADICIDAGRVS